LQSDEGKKIMEAHKIPIHYIDSIIYFESNQIYYKSTAALKLFRNLDGLWKFTYVFMLVPNFIRNIVYDFIAKNRTKWFGKTETCWVMTNELSDRFL
jgi:predicted DCC family thiol-disulfide oxidoreductase YuxK